MKRQLLLYLFILSLLINVFTYAYFAKSNSYEKSRNEKLSKQLKDTTLVMYNKLVDADYFSLENNTHAQNYLETVDFNTLIPKVSDALMEYNTAPEGNKYADQPAFDGKKFIMNKVKVLNHRWIIADYSNGDHWGEALIKYFINDDGTYSFQTIETVLYPKNY